MKMIKEIGLIGYGNFGKFILTYLRKYAVVYIYDIGINSEQLGAPFSSFEEVASKDLVILSVPSQNLEHLLKKINFYVKKDAIVADVCSVKMKPCKLMKKYLPESVEIIGTHPLFGPQSGANGIEGLPIVLCPIRTKRIEEIAVFLDKEYGLNPIITSPENHDKQMAYVQGLTHFISKAILDMEVPFTSMNTKAYDLLLQVTDYLGDDSDDLFLSIQKDNPYAKDARQELMKRLKHLEDSLKDSA